MPLAMVFWNDRPCAQYAEINGVRGAPAILRRVAENAQRIGLISAVGRNPGAPVVEMRDFDIGHPLARWSAITMTRDIASHIADNQTERDRPARLRWKRAPARTIGRG